MTSSTLIFSVEESIQCWLNTDFISIVKYLFFLFKILHYLKVTYSIPKDHLLQMAIVQYFPLLGTKVNLSFLKILNNFKHLLSVMQGKIDICLHFLSISTSVNDYAEWVRQFKKKSNLPYNFKQQPMCSGHIFN